jgi:DNA modification methylase
LSLFGGADVRPGAAEILRGDALDLVLAMDEAPDLVVTDPPYAFGGIGGEHEISATVAVVLRECARRLRDDSWMVVMSASSWRSVRYMEDSVRGLVEPVRYGVWTKPAARTRVQTSGWAWATVVVTLFRKGRPKAPPCPWLDHIEREPLVVGRRAQLPPEVAEWMVAPWTTRGGLALDPFAGSGTLLQAAAGCGMRAVGFERDAGPQPPPVVHALTCDMGDDCSCGGVS